MTNAFFRSCHRVAPRRPPECYSIALPVEKRLADTAVADEVEKRIGQFAHQPPIRIRDSADGALPGATVDDGIAGAVHQGAIYLFRDQLASRLDVQRTLFHELLHYGLRRFLTRDQYVAQMLRLYDRDADGESLSSTRNVLQR